MKNKLLKRLEVLENKKIPSVNARMLRGGMQERLHRQQVLKFKKDINAEKKKIKDKLSLIEKEKLEDGDFGIMLGHFNEPVLTRVRSRRGFFL